MASLGGVSIAHVDPEEDSSSMNTWKQIMTDEMHILSQLVHKPRNTTGMCNYHQLLFNLETQWIDVVKNDFFVKVNTYMHIQIPYYKVVLMWIQWIEFPFSLNNESELVVIELKKIYTWSKNCKGSPHISQTQDFPDGKFTGSNQAYNHRSGRKHFLE